MDVDETIERLKGLKGSQKLNLMSAYSHRDKERGVNHIQEYTGCEKEIAIQVYDMECKKYLEREAHRETHREEFPQSQQYIPRCPTCGSPSVSKINGSKRWLSVGLFGIASSDVGKTMKCNNCGYKW